MKWKQFSFRIFPLLILYDLHRINALPTIVWFSAVLIEPISQADSKPAKPVIVVVAVDDIERGLPIQRNSVGRLGNAIFQPRQQIKAHQETTFVFMLIVMYVPQVAADAHHPRQVG